MNMRYLCRRIVDAVCNLLFDFVYSQDLPSFGISSQLGLEAMFVLSCKAYSAKPSSPM
jgi:hypothetical protein